MLKIIKIAAYNNKIIQNLRKEELRDKNLNRELHRDDINNKNIFAFLQLLRTKEKTLLTKEFQSITIDGWKIVVKYAKRKVYL